MGGKNKLKIVYYGILDQFRQELEMRHSGYATIYDKLNFFINIVKSIDIDDTSRGAEKFQQYNKTTMMKTHLHKIAYTSKLIFIIQLKKN